MDAANGALESRKRLVGDVVVTIAHGYVLRTPPDLHPLLTFYHPNNTSRDLQPASRSDTL
ncbi:hypothetical protein CC2G_008782 [Coprinopsis cinerea AmutBmut pab1-1]|nr:hypothetical protein CC2G_008782 [Coprinopsis cinerea AmutBmut pab1-1]